MCACVFVRVHVRARVLVRMNVPIYMFVCVRVRACVRSGVRACVCVCLFEQFQQRILRAIPGVHWKDMITTARILEQADTTNIEAHIVGSQLSWRHIRENGERTDNNNTQHCSMCVCVCNVCDWMCRSAIGLYGHQRTHRA